MKNHPAIDKYSVIRTYSAGVHCGVVKKVKGKKVTLQDSRRLWSWEGAFTLSSVASKGVKAAKMPAPVSVIYLTEVIEIIPCSPEAEASLREVPVHGL